MEHIAIIELSTHNEVVRSYLIALLSVTNIKGVSVFTNDWNYTQLYDLHPEKKITWFIQPSDQSSKTFLKSNHSELSNQDFIIITTNEDFSGKIIRIHPDLNYGVVIHDVHTQFRFFKHISLRKNIFELAVDLLKLIKYLITKRNPSKLLIDNSQAILLPSQAVMDYTSKIYINKPLILAPFTVNDEYSKPQSHNYINITIPGTITDKSRNYEIVLDAFANLKSQTNVTLNLLGNHNSPYGNLIVKEFQKLSNINLITHKNYVPQKLFDEVMHTTDFLILPMSNEKKFNVVNEKRGYSGVSGNVNDMIRYGLPAIIPAYYPISNEMKSMVYRYENLSSLVDGLNLFIEQKLFNEIKSSHLEEALQGYNKKRIGNLIVQNLTSINLRKL